MPLLSIKNLKVVIDKKPILKGVNLTIKQGETHAIMGPNGSGKSTLAQALFRHPRYAITSGTITFGGKKFNDLTTDKIAKCGILLGFQYPQSIPGVSVNNLLKIAHTSKARSIKINLDSLLKNIKVTSQALAMPEEFLSRSLNEGFSGGEKKKTEVLQISMLKPRLAIFDEIDSGLDIDALKAVAQQITKLQKDGISLLVITHYSRILHYVKPDYVHIMHQGKIVKSGNAMLASEIEREGYGKLIQ